MIKQEKTILLLNNITFPCLFLLHEIKWHLLYLIDRMTEHFLSF